MNFQSFQRNCPEKNLFDQYAAHHNYNQRSYSTKANRVPHVQCASSKVFSMTGKVLSGMNHFNKRHSMPQQAKTVLQDIDNRIHYDTIVASESFLVGGFVGSKSQAGSSSHRGRTSFISDFISQKLAGYISVMQCQKQEMPSHDEYEPNAVLEDNEVPSPSLKEEPINEIPVGRRLRLSECSTDSEDSFIVFDDSDEEETVVLDDICESSSDDDLDEFDCCPLRLENCLTECPESRIAVANKIWNSHYSSPTKSEVTKLKKKVSFAQGRPNVRQIVVWDFAHRAARKGHWEMFARDSERFQRRIQQLSTVINPVLDQQHRDKIFTDRFET